MLVVLLLVNGCARTRAGTAERGSGLVPVLGSSSTAASASSPTRSSPVPSNLEPNGSMFGRKVFDRAKVEAGVLKILTSAPPKGYGATNVTDVVCPDDQPVVAGTHFDCKMTINGASKIATVTVKDNEGRYEVGVPN